MPEIDAKEPERILMSFISGLHELREQNSPVRRRKFGAEQKGALPIILKKLAFILFYSKVYLTNKKKQTTFNLSTSICSMPYYATDLGFQAIQKHHKNEKCHDP